MCTEPASTFITDKIASSALSAISLRLRVRLMASATKLIAVKRGSRKGFKADVVGSGSFIATSHTKPYIRKAVSFHQLFLVLYRPCYEQPRQTGRDFSPA